MGEDRRPNGGGHAVDEQQNPAQGTPDRDQLELRAKSLRKRSGADGHEPPSPPENDGPD